MIYDYLDHLSAGEFDHPEDIDPNVLIRLELMRQISGEAIVPTSDFRPGDDDSTHGDPDHDGDGDGIDIRCHASRPRWRLIEAALRVGFKRVGVYDRHLHLDIGTEEDGFDQEVMWMGESR